MDVRTGQGKGGDGCYPPSCADAVTWWLRKGLAYGTEWRLWQQARTQSLCSTHGSWWRVPWFSGGVCCSASVRRSPHVFPVGLQTFASPALSGCDVGSDRTFRFGLAVSCMCGGLRLGENPPVRKRLRCDAASELQGRKDIFWAWRFGATEVCWTGMCWFDTVPVIFVHDAAPVCWYGLGLTGRTRCPAAREYTAWTQQHVGRVSRPWSKRPLLGGSWLACG